MPKYKQRTDRSHYFSCFLSSFRGPTKTSRNRRKQRRLTVMRQRQCHLSPPKWAQRVTFADDAYLPGLQRTPLSFCHRVTYPPVLPAAPHAVLKPTATVWAARQSSRPSFPATRAIKCSPFWETREMLWLSCVRARACPHLCSHS